MITQEKSHSEGCWEAKYNSVEEMKKVSDQIYSFGVQNGSREMKNKILKKITRDFSLPTMKNPRELFVKILKIIDKLPPPCPVPKGLN
jgi:hypothetical protein